MGQMVETANVAIFKESYEGMVNLVAPLKSNEFKVVVEGYENLTFLFQTFPLPPLKRGDGLEDYGMFGQKLWWYGKPDTTAEISATLKETVTGELMKALKDIVINKKHVNITVTEMGEFGEMDPIIFENTVWGSEEVEHSVEDDTIIKPTIAIKSNWDSRWDAAAA